MTTIGLCESCGRDDEDIVLVRRYYVTPEAWDTAGAAKPGGEEQWCSVCRTHYPHQLLDDEEADRDSTPNVDPVET